MTTGQNILDHKLQATLDKRQHEGRLIIPPSPATMAQMVDFGSNDTLALSSSGALSKAFLRELDRNPGFKVGSSSSRSFDGTKQYLLDIEHDLAHFHGAEAALFVASGFDANVAIWSSIPQPGDFVVYDEYAHASIHDGMRRGRATTRGFRHNDCDSLKHCLEDIRDHNIDIAEARQVVFISLESWYSMDGDATPILDIVEVTREALPLGNYVLSIDEAHSNGVVGPKGSGFICHYGLESEFGLRLNTCGKALGSTGAIILCSETVKNTLMNYARSIIFSIAPSFVSVACVRAGYELVASDEGEKRRRILQRKVQYFYRKLTSHPKWHSGGRHKIMYLPTEDTWHTGPFQSPIIALVTRPQEARSLSDRLHMAKYWANPVHFPVVPKQMDRVRLVIHANNTKEQIDEVVYLIMEWVIDHLSEMSIRAGL